MHAACLDQENLYGGYLQYTTSLEPIYRRQQHAMTAAYILSTDTL